MYLLTKYFTLGVFTLTLILPLSGSKRERLNILYIMADDHTASAIGAYKSHLKDVVQTPELDRLAAEGALFTNVQCTNALCAPSRASILTGLYSHRSGVYTLREDLNTSEIPSVPKVIKKNGYQTAVIGKWHVHGDNLHGFDYYAITRSQGAYVNPALATPNGGKVRLKGYSSDVITDHSLEWLSKRDQDKPFLLMVHFKAAHGPWQYAERHEDMYDGIEIPEPETLFDTYQDRDPNGVATAQSRIHKADSNTSLSYWFETNKKGNNGQWPTGQLSREGLSEEEQAKATYQKYAKDYLRCVKGIDENVGRLRAYLKSEGLLENTVIVYTSDQGMYVGEHGLFDKRLGLTPAMQMPLILRHPSSIPAGSVRDELVNNIDYAETLIDMAGAKVPSSMQGYSFWDLVRETDTQWPRKQSIYQFYSNGVSKQIGLVTEDFKLLKYIGKDGNIIGRDLFDRNQDKHELSSLVTNPEYSSTLVDMERKLLQEMEAIGLSDDKLPGKAPTGKAETGELSQSKKEKKTKGS